MMPSRNDSTHWRNFRAFRAAVAGKPAEERRRLAAALRLGPFGVALAGFAQALAAVENRTGPERDP